eukprot:s61_g26.t1
MDRLSSGQLSRNGEVAAAEALKVLAEKRFKEELVLKCAENYLQGLQKPDETIAARRGYTLCLGALGAPLQRQRQVLQKVLQALRREALGEGLPGGRWWDPGGIWFVLIAAILPCFCVTSGKDQEDPTTRQYAVLSLGRLCIGSELSDIEVSVFLTALEGAMRDYATDRRGDVGSWVREVAMEVSAALLQQQRAAGPPRLANAESSTKLMAQLLQQGVEKIDRLRERSYGLLRMLCNGQIDGIRHAYQRVLHGEAYDAVSLADSLAVVEVSSSSTWPPSEIEMISGCLAKSRETTLIAEPTKADAKHRLIWALGRIRKSIKIDYCILSGSIKHVNDLQAAHDAAVFDALTPLIATPTYRPALLKGIVVSVGGITEHTAKDPWTSLGDAKRALLRQLNTDAARSEVCSELVHLFDTTSLKDSDPEAKRFMAPLLNTVGILLAQDGDAVPQQFAAAFLQRAVAAVKQSRDVTRLRSSIAVFVGIMRWREVKRKALEMLLQFLGYSFPTVRQATAQALYIRFLEEDGDMELVGEAASPVPSSNLSEISELVSLTPWATDDTETLQRALKTIYEKLNLELPQAGRSILVPKKIGEERREAQYADLVRENHF